MIERLRRAVRDARARHRERHHPTEFGFAFADRVDYLDASRWDDVTKTSSLFLRRDVLRVIETHGSENITPRYAMIFRDGKAVVALAAQIIDVRGTRLHRGGRARLLKRPLGAFADRYRERMLVAGNLLSWGFHGLAFAPGESPEALWPGVAEALYRIRRAERLNGQTDLVMVKDVTANESGLESLRRFSYRPLETEPNMVLDIPETWRSYDDYLGALDSKYRQRAKGHAKKLAGEGCSVETLADLGPHAQRLFELYLAVHGNAPVRLVTLREPFLPSLASPLGDDFRCNVVRRDGHILGFVITLRDGDTAVAYYIGFDREAAASGLPLYLRLLHATVADAIHWGCRRLSMGRTALEPKAALGAKPEPMAVWVRHRVPAANWLLRGLLGAVPHAEVPERSPFKKSDS